MKKEIKNMKEYTPPEITVVDINTDIITFSYGDTDTPPVEIDWADW